MTTPTGLNVRAGFDRSLAWDRGNSVRYLVVDLQAPEAPIESRENKKPLNLAIVIDASGSMSGARIHAAKKAALGVAESLSGSDLLSLVSFDSAPAVHLKLCPMNETGQARVRAAITAISAGSCTNLCDGYIEGAQCVAEGMGEHSDNTARVLLLSDGYANEGIVDPRELARIAEGLRERGVLSSTVGIGDDYSTDQIQAIADGGGGLMHDAERPEEIVEVVLGEFGEIIQTYAEEIELRVAHDHRTKLEAVGDIPTTSDPDGTAFRLGSLVSGRSRTVVIRVYAPQGEAGTELHFAVKLTLRFPQQRERVCRDVGEMKLVFAHGDANRTQQRDLGRSLVVAERWQAEIVATALRLNRDGQYREAHKYVIGQARHFENYCRGVPGAEHFAAELRQFADRLERPMAERMRKDVGQQLYSLHRNKLDHRAQQRTNWKAALMQQHGDESEVETYYATFCNGIPVAEIDGRRILIDTGSPISVGNDPLLRIGGRTHRVANTFLGMTVDELCKDTGTSIDVLLGNDILARYYVLLDMEGESFAISPLPAFGDGICRRFSFDYRVPLITVHVEQARIPMFFDTGAQLSYVSTTLTDSRSAEGVAEDFYPGIGRFSTKIFTLQTELDGNQHRMRFGILPAALQASMVAGGAQGILGNELCKYYKIHLAYPRQEIIFEERRN